MNQLNIYFTPSTPLVHPCPGHQWPSIAKSSGQFLVLILLDLSIEFDTVFHFLPFPLGFQDPSLFWFSFYFIGHSFSIPLVRSSSCPPSVNSDVFQALVFRLLLSLPLLPG